MNTRVKYVGTALPLANATVNLFSTVQAFPMNSGAQMMNVARLLTDLVIDTASHLGGTFKWYKSMDGGTNWTQIGSQSAAGYVSASPDSNRLDLTIQEYRDFKLDFTVSTENTTQFDVDMVLTSERAAL